MRSNCSFITVALAAFALILAGCGGEDAPVEETSDAARGVVILDLDAVARSLGRMESMANEIKRGQASLNAQGQKFAADLQKQIDASIKKMGEKPTDEQKKKHTALVLDVRRKLNSVGRQIEQKKKLHFASVTKKFQDEVRPFAEEIAKKRGATAVFYKSKATMLWTAPNTDITDRVAEAMRQAGPVVPAPVPTPPRK